VNKSEIELEIKKALGNISGSFQKDELAFLALTSKPELTEENGARLLNPKPSRQSRRSA
jgi:hypothetical protein